MEQHNKMKTKYIQPCTETIEVAIEGQLLNNSQTLSGDPATGPADAKILFDFDNAEADENTTTVSYFNLWE